jgi:hypothetical protein
MKASTTAAAMLCWLLLPLAWMLTAEAQDEVRIVEDSAFETRLRPPVPFLHDAHNDKAGIEECSVCHHVYEGGRRLEDESSEDRECSECHGAPGRSGRLQLATVYHQRCKGCHEQSSAGPVQCSECHPR